MSDAPPGARRLAAFSCELHPPGGAPLEVTGRIEGGHYCLFAARRGQRYAVELSSCVEHTEGGAFAWVEPGTRPLGPGLWVTLSPADAGAARAVALSLRLETRSAALERGAPLFARLGGGPELARLLSPPRWTATLGFDAAGAPVRATDPRADLQ